MNSLVVLFSVMALAAAKPGFYESGIVSYASPAIAVAPAAVSHQSRLDIKSSPALVATETVAPLTRAVIAEPAYAAPIAYAAPNAYIAQPVYAAPLAVAAPAAVSSQSRVDIKSSPASLVSTFAAPVTFAAAPVAYTSPIAATYASSIYAPAIGPGIPVVKSVAINPIAPVNTEVLPEAPVETPEVAAARAAHFEAKALEESHAIHKRSLGVVATAPVISSYAATPVISSYTSPVVYPASITRVGAPITVSAPILSSAYGIHPY